MFKVLVNKDLLDQIETLAGDPHSQSDMVECGSRPHCILGAYVYVCCILGAYVYVCCKSTWRCCESAVLSKRPHLFSARTFLTGDCVLTGNARLLLCVRTSQFYSH